MSAHRILRAAIRVCEKHNWRSARNRFECINSAPHYCESGYSTDKGEILFGNWNGPTPSKWDESQRKFTREDKHAAESLFFSRVVKALESVAELEWEDEWTTCSECGGAVRTSADSYGWQRGYVELDGEILCSECAAKHAGEVIAQFENEDSKCLMSDLGIDPADHGFTRLDQDFEHGLYGGQDADPKKIAATLRNRGITRFVFVLDSVGQFDASFSVWIHKSESKLLKGELSHAESACDLDPAEGLKRALQNVPPVTGKGITYVKCDPRTGTSTARKVSPDEFRDGIKD